ncbi:hypothetical protein [Mycolicibacterium sarraceniae]|uniref:hypothetical protein n=1 Tax=Mycolicibacterium sarraceniae TaxID=1534348 RepID=UPI0013D08C99|nr:hypothetical protein [Mycolicibacterium sarraceniae]
MPTDDHITNTAPLRGSSPGPPSETPWSTPAFAGLSQADEVAVSPLREAVTKAWVSIPAAVGAGGFAVLAYPAFLVLKTPTPQAFTPSWPR